MHVGTRQAHGPVCRPIRRPAAIVAAACVLAGLAGCRPAAPEGLSVYDPLVEAKRPFVFPADFEPQSAVLLACNELVPYHPRAFADVVTAARAEVPLIGLVSNARERRAARRLLQAAHLPPASVRFVELPANTMWVRDYGPVFVRSNDGSALVIDAVYPPRRQKRDRSIDDAVPRRLAALLGLPVVAAPLKLEGGNLLSNGDGLCVTSTAVLARNAVRGFDASSIRRLLADCLGCKSVLFLEPLRDEPTEHVDMFVCFAAPNIAVVARVDPSRDAANARLLDEAARKLAGLPTSRGALRVHRIAMPPRRGKAWRTYTNVLFAGRAVLVPTYTGVDPCLNRRALDLYARLLPERTVVGVNCDSLAEKGGALRCISLNVPAFVRGLAAPRRPPPPAARCPLPYATVMLSSR